MNPETRNANFSLAALWPWCAIWGGAFLVRLIYFWQVRDTDLMVALVGDASVYDAWAQRIAAGAWLGDKVFYQAPLYPYFLGVIYAFGGHSLMLVRIIQIGVGAFSCVFLGRATEYFISRPAGYVAGVLMALCPALIFFDCLIQKAVLDVFFLTLVWLAAAIAPRSRGAKRWWLALGAAIGFVTLTRENALVMLPLLVLWAWQHGRGRAALMVVAGTACVLVPVALRNRLVGGELHLTTAQMGPNFYIGNNERANGGYQPLRPRRGNATYEQADATDLAEGELGRKLTPGEVSGFWMGKSFAFIRAQPWAWTKLMARKWLLVWNAAEMGDTEEQGAFAAYSPLLRWLSAGLHFGVLGPLAMAGVVWMWGRRRDLWIVVAVSLTYAASVAAFYVFARYRLPLFPMAILFASGALIEIRGRLRWPLAPSTWTGILALIATATVVNWPLVSRDLDGMVTLKNLGLYFTEQREYERAIVYLDKVLEQVPASDEAHAAKGLALSGLKKYDDAITQFKTALELNPNFPEVEINLGNALTARGRAIEALPHFDRALRLKPESAEIHYNLGNAQLSLGRTAEAIGSYEKAVQLQPDFADAHNNIGSVLFQAGRTDEALEHFRKVAALRPAAAGTHANLGVALAKTGHAAEAIREYELALAADPAQTAAMSNLAWVLATCPDASLRDGARAVELASKSNEITRGNNPSALRSLAAALAETGHFPEAEQAADSAVSLLEAQGERALAEVIKGERDGYRAGRPFRGTR